MILKIPLAWLQLTKRKVRLLVALAGIGFATMLMFVQLGFQDALYDSAIRVHKALHADLFLVSPQSQALINMESFSRRRLYEMLAVPGVESASSLYVNFGIWKDPWENTEKRERQKRSIMVFGFDPSKTVFDLADVRQNQNQLSLQDVVLFDRACRRNFGPIAEEFEQKNTLVTEVNNRRIRVVGLFKLGTSFGIDGTIITSDLNFIRLFENRRIEQIDLGLINLKSGYDSQEVFKKIADKLPKDIEVMTRQKLEEVEKKYWTDSTPVGFVFKQGVAIAFIVGAVIVYQILYSDVADHLAEYATLKAMGYRDIYLLRLVWREAMILAILGYIPGFVMALGVYSFSMKATLLPIGMTWDRALLVMILTILMCLISAGIAVRKLQSADPADIF